MPTWEITLCAMCGLRSPMKIVPQHYEDIESILRRFKKGVSNAGILTDARKHEHYEKPSVKRKRKSIKARIRLRKHLEGLGVA